MIGLPGCGSSTPVTSTSARVLTCAAPALRVAKRSFAFGSILKTG